MTMFQAAQLAVLEEVSSHLHDIGSANDAEDHGYVDDARQMRAAAAEALLALLEAQPFLEAALPGFRAEIESGHIYGHVWSELLTQIAWIQTDPEG